MRTGSRENWLSKDKKKWKNGKGKGKEDTQWGREKGSEVARGWTGQNEISHS